MDLVRVTFKMLTPVVMSAPLHFDSLLAAVHPAMHNLANCPTRYDRNEEDIRQAPLPICSAKKEKQWVWAASAAEFPDDAEIKSSSIVKNWSPADVENFELVLSTATGALRNRLVRFPMVVSPEIYFYCVTKNINQLNRITKRVNRIGGVRKSGYGVVSDFEIELLQEPLTNAICFGGIARRRLPVSFGDCTNQTLQRIHPPYWSNCDRVKSCEAGSAFALQGVTIK